jgi:SAM-dependent methyltransferase
MTATDDNWAAGDAYESYMGRWSRPMARIFVGWMGGPHGGRWLEVGCGTGALTGAICELAEPASVVACDPSESFLAHARKGVRDGRVSFVVASAETLPGGPGEFDCVVSGLALNFVPDPAGAIGRMRQRLCRGGTLGAYVWNYTDGVEFLRCFWDEAVALDAAAADLDEGRRFPLCHPDALTSLFVGAGLRDVVVESLEIPTRFQDFNDFWTPFLRGTGPAPSYAASLSDGRQTLLRERLASRLKVEADGGIRLKARAWAVRGLSE